SHSTNKRPSTAKRGQAKNEGNEGAWVCLTCTQVLSPSRCIALSLNAREDARRVDVRRGGRCIERHLLTAPSRSSRSTRTRRLGWPRPCGTTRSYLQSAVLGTARLFLLALRIENLRPPFAGGWRFRIRRRTALNGHHVVTLGSTHRYVT